MSREHLPLDIIDILERLEKADNIPFNQLYTLAENCADHYYSKVIKTLILLIFPHTHTNHFGGYKKGFTAPKIVSVWGV